MKPDCVYLNATCTMGRYVKLDCPCVSYRKDPEKKIDGSTETIATICLNCTKLEKRIAELEAHIAELEAEHENSGEEKDEIIPAKRRPGRPRK